MKHYFLNGSAQAHIRLMHLLKGVIKDIIGEYGFVSMKDKMDYNKNSYNLLERGYAHEHSYQRNH
ncbi:MAG: hypothetical protein K0Q53_1530 [Massilibacillus sp.]|nr:hypothetical protein [Massilibacillus sp.]